MHVQNSFPIMILQKNITFELIYSDLKPTKTKTRNSGCNIGLMRHLNYECDKTMKHD